MTVVKKWFAEHISAFPILSPLPQKGTAFHFAILLLSPSLPAMKHSPTLSAFAVAFVLIGTSLSLSLVLRAEEKNAGKPAPGTEAESAITPAEPIDLLALGEDEVVYHINPDKALTDDPGEVWRMTDEGQMHVIGKAFGYVRTKAAYRDYHLVMEYKWGERTWSSREDRARDCGLLVHSHGPDGALNNTWISSVEAQLIEGGSGDILVLAAKDESQPDGRAPTRATAEVKEDRDGEPVWTPGGEKRVFPPEGKYNARINWRDRDPDWADVRGFRGDKDIENPVGEWNRMEVVCEDDRIRILLNGELINEVSEVQPASGYISLQGEFAECFVRRLELHPLGEFKEKWATAEGSTDTGYSVSGESLLPRRLPLSPEESATLWEIDGDYELELVASEPLVSDPVDIAWDEDGRLFVAEMRDYPLPAGEGEFLSRIRLLEDSDGDGKMDKASTWADDLDHVQGLLPMNGGLLATTRTAILFLQDSDGDGTADVRKPLFRTNEPRHNQLQVSSPRWGVDNCIYLSNGLDGKEIYPEGEKDTVVEFPKLDLRYDPRGGGIEAVTGGGQYGGTIDDFGRRFVCSNRNPTIFAAMPLEAVKRNPLAGIITGREDIQPQAAPVWPIALSHTTSSAHAGTYTAACGLAVYRGDLLPDLAGDVLVCEPTGQLVTRSKLVPKGASFTTERIGDKRDFLVSGDEWTRPVMARNGPDGALYVVDMYRRFIDHARFFPDEFVASNYMRAGLDHGRIWRLAPKRANAGSDSSAATEPLPDQASALVKELSGTNGWRRTHAARRLVELDNRSVAPALRALIEKGDSPEGAVRALWILQQWDELSPGTLGKAMDSDSPGLVENALELIARTDAGGAPLRARAAAAWEHPDPRVAFLALALFPPGEKGGAGEESGTVEEIAALLAEHPDDPWLRRAVTSSRGDSAAGFLAALLADPARLSPSTPARTDLLADLATLAAANGDLGGLRGVLERLGGEPTWRHFAVVRGLSQGLRKGPLRKQSLATLASKPPEELVGVAGNLASLLADAKSLVLDSDRSAADRSAALPIVAQQGLEKTLPVVEQLIGPSVPSSLQAAACQSLSGFDKTRVAQFFFERWDSLPPTPMREALALVTSNPKSGLLLMKKMKAGEINPSIMPAMTRWSYGRSKNEEIKALAKELFGQSDGDRAAVVSKYREGLGEHQGDAERGKAVFEKAACITCHQLGGLGVDVGPPLADVRAKPPVALLTDILDPNRAVEERWVSTVVEKKDGTVLSGLIASEDETGVTLRLPGGIDQAVPRAEIASFANSGQSLMPVGLEATITVQEMADLIAFLKAR